MEDQDENADLEYEPEAEQPHVVDPQPQIRHYKAEMMREKLNLRKILWEREINQNQKN